MKDNLAIFWEDFSQVDYGEVEIYASDGKFYYLWTEGGFSVGWYDVLRDDSTSHYFGDYPSVKEAMAAKVFPGGRCLNDIIRETDISKISMM